MPPKSSKTKQSNANLGLANVGANANSTKSNATGKRKRTTFGTWSMPSPKPMPSLQTDVHQSLGPQIQIQTLGQQQRPRQSFRRRLEPQYERLAGDSVVLSCEVAEQAGEAFWVYKQSHNASSYYLFARNGQRAEGAKESYVLLGDPQAGNHTLELRHLQPNDSGEYECQITAAPEDLDGLELRTSTKLIVNQPPPPPLEASSSSQDSLASISTQQQDHHMMMTKLEQSSAFQPAQLLHHNRPASSVILASSSAASSAHPTAASTTSASTSSTSASTFGLVLAWPNLLLLLAALLMLANVYLVYSLVQRHRRNQRQRNKQQAYRQAPSDGSVESAATSSSSGGSNGSSSTNSAATTSSRLATTQHELSCTELDLSSSVAAVAAVASAHLEPPARCHSATLQQPYQHHLNHPQRFSPSVNLTGPTISQLQIQQQQPLYHQQSQHAFYTLDPKQHQLNPATVGYCLPQQQQQQQQQQQHFVPVDLNGWVLEI